MLEPTLFTANHLDVGHFLICIPGSGPETGRSATEEMRLTISATIALTHGPKYRMSRTMCIIYRGTLFTNVYKAFIWVSHQEKEKAGQATVLEINR